MQKDAFKPQGREISVVGVGSPLMGQGNMPTRMVSMAPPSVQGRQAPAPAPAPRGGGAPIGGRADAFKPMGQPVRIMGSGGPALDGGAVDRSASFQPSSAPIAPSPAPAPGPEMAGDPQPMTLRGPFLQRNLNGSTVFRVTMHCRMGDGSEYASVHDAEFPPGAQPMRLDYSPLA